MNYIETVLLPEFLHKNVALPITIEVTNTLDLPVTRDTQWPRLTLND